MHIRSTLQIPLIFKWNVIVPAIGVIGSVIEECDKKAITAAYCKYGVSGRRNRGSTEQRIFENDPVEVQASI